MAGDQDDLYIELGKKLYWVEDSPDPLVGESFPRLQEAIKRLSHGRPLFYKVLPPEEAEELSRLCDAVAAENGHRWRPRGVEIRQAKRSVADRDTGRKQRGFWRRNRD